MRPGEMVTWGTRAVAEAACPSAEEPTLAAPAADSPRLGLACAGPRKAPPSRTNESTATTGGKPAAPRKTPRPRHSGNPIPGGFLAPRCWHGPCYVRDIMSISERMTRGPSLWLIYGACGNDDRLDRCQTGRDSMLTAGPHVRAQGGTGSAAGTPRPARPTRLGCPTLPRPWHAIACPADGRSRPFRY